MGGRRLYFSAQFAMLIAQCSCFLQFTFISLFFHICGYLYPHVFVLQLYSNINALVVYLYLSLLRHLRCSLLMYQRIVPQYSAVQGVHQCIAMGQWLISECRIEENADETFSVVKRFLQGCIGMGQWLINY